jgi:hypothetical protein
MRQRQFTWETDKETRSAAPGERSGVGMAIYAQASSENTYATAPASVSLIRSCPLDGVVPGAR